jgi:hypothetical protein
MKAANKMITSSIAPVESPFAPGSLRGSDLSVPLSQDASSVARLPPKIVAFPGATTDIGFGNDGGLVTGALESFFGFGCTESSGLSS